VTEPREVLDARRGVGDALDARAAAGLDPPPSAVPAPIADIEPMMVVQEGWSGQGIFFFLAGLGGAAVAVWLGMDLAGLIRTPAEAARTLGLIGLGGIAAFFPLRRRLLRYRHEFRLDAKGVSLWLSDPALPEREWTRIPWTDILVFATDVGPNVVRLSVVRSDRRYIELTEAPPRPATMAFVRRFQQEAERHPRAPEVSPEMDGPRGDPVFGLRTLAYAAVGGALVWVGNAMQGRLRVPATLQLPILFGAMSLYLGVRLWLQLDDSDIAHTDRGSRTWMGRIRNRLRALFGIRHV
jgi:hypothetical protein